MTDAVLIDGKAFAAQLREAIGRCAATLKAEHGLVPGLAACWSVRIPPVRSMSGTRKNRQLRPVWHRLDAVCLPMSPRLI